LAWVRGSFTTSMKLHAVTGKNENHFAASFQHRWMEIGFISQ
jgi:hypothetical protein